jgi:tripartite-type tricarboxylate transporter receptor subunit TctC
MKAIAFLGAILVSFGIANAQDRFPSKPIQILSPQSPGSATDLVGRMYADKLSRLLGQSVIVQNRPGAGGVLAAQTVAKSAPDGYTLMVVNTQHSMNPALFKDIPFDTVRDFSAVAMVADAPALVYAAPSMGVRTLAEFLALARQKPGEINYGSGGTGSATHLAGAYFASRAGINLVHVPYKTGADLIADILTGRIQVTFSPVAFMLSQVREGKLLALAVTSRQRMSALPDVPTVDEAGLPGYESSTYYGFIAPAKTPRAVIDQLSRALRAAAEDKEIQERYVQQGMVPNFLPPDEFDAFIKADVERVKILVKAIGASVN